MVASNQIAHGNHLDLFQSEVLINFLSTGNHKRPRSQSAEQTPCTWQVEVIKNPTTTIEIRVPKTAKVKIVNLKKTKKCLDSIHFGIHWHCSKILQNHEETQCISVQIPTLAMENRNKWSRKCKLSTDRMTYIDLA